MLTCAHTPATHTTSGFLTLPPIHLPIRHLSEPSSTLRMGQVERGLSRSTGIGFDLRGPTVLEIQAGVLTVRTRQDVDIRS